MTAAHEIPAGHARAAGGLLAALAGEMWPVETAPAPVLSEGTVDDARVAGVGPGGASAGAGAGADPAGGEPDGLEL
ncbi:MAG TPA: hypothetical protein VF743_01960, partial [Acidimicrobiales bacterium]